MKSLAVIGYGALGKILCSILVKELSEDYDLTGIFDLALKEEYIEVEGKKIPIFQSFEEVLQSHAELVVEIAGVGAVREFSIPILRTGKDLVITSVGALSDEKLLESVGRTAKEEGHKVHLTSGAIGGFDILSTVAMMGDADTRIESTKAPKSLNGAPYLNGKTLPSDRLVIVFEGTAKEAIEGFPKNTNVAVATELAGGGKPVKVCVISDPEAEGNTHRIHIENETARATIEVAAKTDPKNPKSSVTAAWSVAALLKNLASPIQLF